MLLLGLAGLVWGLRGGSGGPERAEAVAITAGFLGLALFIVFRTNNYGGGHYGMRWFLMMVPLLMYLAVPILRGLRSRWEWGLLALLILPGLYTAHLYWFGKPTVYELLMMRHGFIVLPP